MAEVAAAMITVELARIMSSSRRWLVNGKMVSTVPSAQQERFIFMKVCVQPICWVYATLVVIAINNTLDLY